MAIKGKSVLKQEQMETLKEDFGTRVSEIFKREKLRNELKQLTVFLTLLGVAVGGRVALQYVPSVEPIIPLAVTVGMIYGIKEGFVFGSSAYIISNFLVWGLQGPWTIFQAIGAALAGGFGGAIGKVKNPTGRDLIIASVIGTILFEILMNISGPFMGIGLLGAFGLFTIPLYFATSLPFSLVHCGSNVIFAKMCNPLLKLRRSKNEIKVVSVSRVGAGGNTSVRVYKSDK